MRTDCFGNVLREAPKYGNCLVVHGTVIQATTGNRIDHAWIEADGMVIDPTIPVTMPRENYYHITQAQADACYTTTGALVNAVRSRHKGPWRPDERLRPSVL